LSASVFMNPDDHQNWRPTRC